MTFYPKDPDEPQDEEGCKARDANSEYTDCGGCNERCDGGPEVCTNDCRQGCRCIGGTVKDDFDRCITKAECDFYKQQKENPEVEPDAQNGEGGEGGVGGEGGDGGEVGEGGDGGEAGPGPESGEE